MDHIAPRRVPRAEVRLVRPRVQDVGSAAATTPLAETLSQKVGRIKTALELDSTLSLMGAIKAAIGRQPADGHRACCWNDSSLAV